MKLRKLLSITLALLMVAGLIPALLVPASAAATQPQALPELGSDFYVEALTSQETWSPMITTGTINATIQTKPASGTASNWVNASGVMFQIKATDGTWLTDTSATQNPYAFFSVIAVAQHKVTKFNSSKVEDGTGYATFDNIDYCFGQKNKESNIKMINETASMYYSNDGGLTWDMLIQTETLNHKFYGVDLTKMNAEGTWIYIPMEEFFYYGGWVASGETYGVTKYYGGVSSFQEGVGILQAAGNTALHSFQIKYRPSAGINSGATGAQSDVSASDIRLVYDIVDEVKTSENADSVDLYVNQPNLVTDQVVTATVGNSAPTTLSGTKQTDGRVKYSVTGINEDYLGSKVTFTYTSAAKAISKTASVALAKPKALETLPSSLVTTSSPNLNNSNLYKRSAVFAGDSLIEAVRDSSAGGWSGRLATAYSMSNTSLGIGGKTLSAWYVDQNVYNKNPGVIFTQLSSQIKVSNTYAREQVDYVILDGGINDINREGHAIGSVSANALYGHDLETVAGSLEHTFATAKRAYPNATVGFIILFQMPLANASGSDTTPLKCQDMEYSKKFVDTVKAVCEKWGVHYLNMFEDEAFNDLIDTDNTASAYLDKTDMLHLNEAGYELTAPYVAAWMESLPLAEGSTATIYEKQPVTLPNGEGYHADLWKASTAAGSGLNFNFPVKEFNDWYQAQGVMFKIDATNAGRWQSNANAVANDTYWCFDLAIYTYQMVMGYDSASSTSTAANYGVFWTNDNFYGQEQTGALANASSMLYYTEDAGKTWNTSMSGVSTSSSREKIGVFALDLTDVNTEDVWVYIPLSNFYYYGAYAGSANATGTSAGYRKGFDTLENGIDAVIAADNANVPDDTAKPAGVSATAARNFMFTNSTPSTVTLDGASSALSGIATPAVTITNLQFVYDAIDTASVTVENDLSMSIYVEEPEHAAGIGNVTATMNGETVKLAGKTQDDGRIKYTLDGILPQEMGDEIEFFWQTGKTGLGQKITMSVKDYAETLLATTTDDTLRTLLNTMLHYGAEAQKAKNYKVDALCNANAGAVTNVTVANLTAPYTTPTAAFTTAQLALDDALMFKIGVADGVTAVSYACGEFNGALEIVDGYAYFDVYAHRAADEINLTANGETWTLSLNWYLKSVTVESQLGLVQAIANYTGAAAAYKAAN